MHGVVFRDAHEAAIDVDDEFALEDVVELLARIAEYVRDRIRVQAHERDLHAFARDHDRVGTPAGAASEARDNTVVWMRALGRSGTECLQVFESIDELPGYARIGRYGHDWVAGKVQL